MKRRVQLTIFTCLLLLGALQGPASEAQSELFADAETIEELLSSADYRPGTDAQLLRYYIAFFDRQPDLEGARYWLGLARDGHDAQSIAGWMSDGQEFANAYDGLDGRSYLELVYQNVLGRNFDLTGFDYWLDFVAGTNSAGQNPDRETLSRSDLVFFVAQSTEFANNHPFTPPQVPGVEFTGTGDRVIRVNKPASHLLFYATHSGSSNFIVTGFDADGRRTQLFVNEIGPYEGRTMESTITDEVAVLEIQADGSWTIGFDTLATAHPLTDGNLAGSGDDVVALIQPAGGTETISMQHAGPSNFIVTARNRNGANRGLLANEIGAYDGQRVLTKGTELLVIRAHEGTWTISIR